MKYYRVIIDDPDKAGELIIKECEFNDTEALLKIIHQMWRDNIDEQPRIRIRDTED